MNASDLPWIKIDKDHPLPEGGNFLVCEDFDAVANVFWDQAPLSDGLKLYVDTFDGPSAWYKYKPTHYIKI